MTPEMFWESTVREVLLMIKAFDERELTELRRLRFLRYDTYCLNTKESDRISIYEYMPLKGDPTKEQLAEMEQEQEEEKQKELREAYNYLQQIGAI